MRLTLPILLLFALLAACAPAAPLVPTATVSPTAAPSLTLTPTKTPMPKRTFIPPATNTPTPTRQTTPTTTVTPGPPRAGMELIFADEFDAPALDSTKWSPCYPWDNQGCTNSGNAEEEWYLPDEVLVEGGLLRLRARENPVTGSDGKAYPYTSGMISSHGKFFTQYGFFEMRAKMPPGAGLWPAFWLLPESREWPPEIDILEVIGDKTQWYYTTLHYKTADNPHLGQGISIDAGADLAAGFHTYAADWQPGVITWFLDGKQVYQVTENVPAQPMYLIANLAVGGTWPGHPAPETAFPAYFEVDYIRVYQ